MQGTCQALKRARPATDDQFCEEIRKPMKKVLTREMYYGLEKDFFGNLEKKADVRIKNTTYNFDRDKVMEQYTQTQEAAKSVEAVYAREKSLLREAFAMRERRKMVPENGGFRPF